MNTWKNGLLWLAVAAALWVLAGVAHGAPAEGFRPIESRIFDGAKYDGRTRTLTVLFDSGACYAFREVPREVYLDFTRIVNPGEYFNKRIRNVYPFTRVDRYPSAWATRD